MPSFDVVSKTDLAEVDNAVANMTREIIQRYDFKGSKCTIVRKEEVLTLNADDELKLKQMHELLQGHLARRKIEVGVLDYQDPERAAGQSMRQTILIKQGIGKELGKRLAREIKDAKLKVQAAIQGDEVRISGKKRDDLQDAIALLKALKIEQPLQFTNFRD